MSEIQRTIAWLERGESLSSGAASDVMEEVVSGTVTTQTLTRWLHAMSTRLPTADELHGCSKALMAHAVRVPCRTPAERILDTCGTGGAPKCFNVGTLAALLVASMGAPVAKHGNRSRTGFGSAETLEALGVDLSATPDAQAHALDASGFCFCMAPRHHPGMAHAAASRRSIQGPTIFNAVGPLCNPAGALRRVLGVWHHGLMQPMAEVLARLGATRALVVHAEDGLDEISVSAPTHFIRVEAGAIVDRGVLTPDMFGIRPLVAPVQACADLPESVQLARSLLAGSCRSAHRDMLVVNAAAALMMAGRAASWTDAASLTQACIASGDAMALLERLIS